MEIDMSDLPETFADFFGNKIQDFVKDTKINYEAYNGQKRIFENCSDFNFMS